VGTLDRVVTPRRLHLYPIAVLIGAVIGLAVFWATSNGLRTAFGGRIGGDFPAFYGAARIVRAGNIELLYEPPVQRRAQTDILPDVEDGWVHFAYPPQVAALYVPFTLFDFKTAYALHTLLMAACCIASFAMLARALPRMRSFFLPAVAAALTFYPLFRSIVGGQNTAVSLLCAAAAAACLASRREFLAGLCLSAWLFKPQFALPAAAILVLGGHPRVLPGLACGAAAWYVSGALLADPSWPLWWWREGVVPFVAADLIVDRGNGISLKEVASDLGVPVIGWIALALTGAYVVRSTWRTRAHPAALVGLASAAAILMAPHALFYDGGLAVLGLAAAGAIIGGPVHPLLAGMWLLAAMQALRAYLPVPPLLVVSIVSLVLAARSMGKSGPDERLTTEPGPSPGSRG
jgi:hypothetical protein